MQHQFKTDPSPEYLALHVLYKVLRQPKDKTGLTLM